MSLKLILFVIITFSLQAFATDWKKLKFVNGCKIYNPGGYMEKNFPGAMCIFLDNGNLITSSETSVRMINPKNEVLWEVKGHFHHQMNLSYKKDKILILSSDEKGGQREDTFNVIDLEGKVLHTQKASELLSFANLKPLNWRMNPQLFNGVTLTKEISHFNSIYDIPPQSKKRSLSWLNEGNIVVNGSGAGIFILSPDLSRVLHHINYKGSTNNRLHDVQVKPNGNLIFFNNLVAVGKPMPFYISGPVPTMNYSAVQEINPENLNIVEEFTAKPKTMFYSWICGNIQELDDDLWLFTHFLTGTYIYSKSKKDFVASIPGTHADDQRFNPAQQVRAQDLTKFLSYWP